MPKLGIEKRADGVFVDHGQASWNTGGGRARRRYSLDGSHWFKTLKAARAADAEFAQREASDERMRAWSVPSPAADAAADAEFTRRDEADADAAEAAHDARVDAYLRRIGEAS